jgi:hypothetical protein
MTCSGIEAAGLPDFSFDQRARYAGGPHGGGVCLGLTEQRCMP